MIRANLFLRRTNQCFRPWRNLALRSFLSSNAPLLPFKIIESPITNYVKSVVSASEMYKFRKELLTHFDPEIVRCSNCTEIDLTTDTSRVRFLLYRADCDDHKNLRSSFSSHRYRSFIKGNVDILKMFNLSLAQKISSARERSCFVPNSYFNVANVTELSIITT